MARGGAAALYLLAADFAMPSLQCRHRIASAAINLCLTQTKEALKKELEALEAQVLGMRFGSGSATSPTPPRQIAKEKANATAAEAAEAAAAAGGSEGKNTADGGAPEPRVCVPGQTVTESKEPEPGALERAPMRPLRKPKKAEDSAEPELPWYVDQRVKDDPDYGACL